MTDKKMTAFLFSPEDYAILDLLQAKYQMSRAAIVRLAIRQFAEREGMALPTKPQGAKPNVTKRAK